MNGLEPLPNGVFFGDRRPNFAQDSVGQQPRPVSTGTSNQLNRGAAARAPVTPATANTDPQQPSRPFTGNFNPIQYSRVPNRLHDEKNFCTAGKQYRYW